MRRYLVFAFAILFAIQTTSSAQIEKINLAGRHSVYFESGFKMNSKTTVVTNANNVETRTGFVGSFNYAYWFEDEWALTLSAGVFGAETSVKFNNVEANAIVPILFGVRYYPAKFALGSVGRVYTGLALGSYMGTATKTKTLFSTETLSESVFGGQVFAGIDMFVTSWLKFGPKLSYYFLGDFKEIIGTEKNLSGAAFSLDFGFVL
jgi:hypothetical protein